MSKNGNKLKNRPHAGKVIAVAILAGGLSRRLGQDKAKLAVGRATLLRRIRDTAARTDYPVRVVRNDIVPRCGPLGGILTAFARTRADLIVFLACDMPAVSADWIIRVARAARQEERPVFSAWEGRWGFPFALRRGDLQAVVAQRRSGDFSMRSLAEALQALPLAIPSSRARELFNINTPEDWAAYRASI